MPIIGLMIKILFQTYSFYADFMTYTDLWIMLMREMREKTKKPEEESHEKMASV
jgi:hypothetical protein